MPSTPYAFSLLGPADVPLLRQLNTMFGAAFKEPDTYTARPPSDRYLATLLAKRHVIAIAALSDGQVVGGLVAYELEKFERERSEFYLYDLAVDAAHRGRKVATGLIARLRDVAAERGGAVIFVQADYGDGPAFALYGKPGSREDVLHFDIPVQAAS